MPLQHLPAWPPGRISRHPDPLIVEGPVRLTVVEIVLESAAHEEAAIRSDRHVSLIEEAVDIGP